MALTFQDLTTLATGEHTAVCLTRNDAFAHRLRSDVLDTLDAQAYLETLSITTPERWLVSLWEESLPERYILRPVQLMALAEHVITSSEALPDNVLQPNQIIRQFVEAFKVVDDYALSADADGLSSLEHQLFQQWRNDLYRALEDQEAIAACQLPGALAAQVQAGAVEVPDRVILDEALTLTPAEQRLVDTLAEAGVTIDRLASPPAQQPELSMRVMETVTEEVDAIAQWVGALLSDTQQPPRVAVAVPRPDEYEESLRRAFERHVFPYAIVPTRLPEGVALHEPWRVGRGSLATYPVIGCALDILRLTATALDIEHVSRLLRSSFIRDAESARSAREALDFRLRDDLPSRVTLKAVQFQANKLRQNETLAPLVAAVETMTSAPKQLRPSEWVRQFDSELTAAGWPNRDPGDDVIDQARTAFSQVMDTVRALDYQLGQIDRNDALRWLQSILQSKRFELARDEAPVVELLALDDIPGRTFDAMWVAGLTDAAVPRAPINSPFLNKNRCIDAGVPFVSADDCLDRDSALLAALPDAAASVVMSCPGHSADGIAATPCLLVEWEAGEATTDNSPALPVLSFGGTFMLRDEDQPRPVSDEELVALRGGTAIFKDMGGSPLLAFLRHRLHIRPFPTRNDGIDPASQGNWLHGTLERFWAETQSSAQLATLSPDALTDRLRRCVDEATEGMEFFGARLMTIERERLVSLSAQWIELERRREHPFTVESIERRWKSALFGIPLTVRIDRTDQVDVDGQTHRLIMDYKTGRLTASDLNATQLLEPQLPLYAVLGTELFGDTGANGLAVATVRDGECGFHVRSDWSDKITRGGSGSTSGVNSEETWAAELSAWESTLGDYAARFLAGSAAHNYSASPARFRYHPFVAGLSINEG